MAEKWYYVASEYDGEAFGCGVSSTLEGHEFVWFDDGIDVDADMKRAHLIAAAPELLDALEAALTWIDEIPTDTTLPAMPGFDRDEVNDVIRKAKGEA